jgi:prepilin-type N-terminal cleavage/methylation domain-containing protein
VAQTVHPNTLMRNRSRGFGSAGFSLVEMLIVVCMIALMALFAYPKVAVIFNQTQVRSARLAVLNKFNQARMIARTSSRHSFLIRQDTILWVERTPRVVPLGGSTRDTVGGYLNLGQYGVTVTGLDTVNIDPRGLTGGGGAIVVTRQGLSDSVVISGFGRISR